MLPLMLLEAQQQQHHCCRLSTAASPRTLIFYVSVLFFSVFFLFFVFVSDSDVFPFYFVTYVDVNLRHRKALRSSSLKTKNAQKNNNKRGVYVEGEKKKN